MKDRGQEPHFAGGLRRPATISPSSREWLALSGLVDRRLSVSRSNSMAAGLFAAPHVPLYIVLIKDHWG